MTRLSETAFLAVVPGATLQRNLAWMRSQLGDDFAVITDMTAAESVLCVMGPKARDLMARVSPADFSNAAHPFGMAKEIEIGMGLARAHRVTYVGELGWELYVSSDQTAHVFEALEEAGADLGLKLAWESADHLWHWAGDTAPAQQVDLKMALLQACQLPCAWLGQAC